MAAPASRDDVTTSAARWFDRRENGSDRLPVLEDALSAIARLMQESFSALSTMPGEVSFQGLRSARIETVAPPRRGGSVFAVIEAPAWDAMLGVHFDHALIGAMVEALFGGDGGDPDLGGRASLSPVETRIGEVVAGLVTDAFTTGFAALRPSRFVLKRVLPAPDAGLLGKARTPMLVATFTLATMGQRLALDVLFPCAATTFFAAAAAPPTVAPDMLDPNWSRQLEAEVSRAVMILQASIDMGPMSLGDVAKLRLGQVLELPNASGSAVMLRCEGGDLFRCELGQSGGLYTIRVGDAVTPFRRKHEALGSTLEVATAKHTDHRG